MARAALTAAQVRGPTSAEAIAAVQHELPKPLPDDLVRWWRCADGFEPGVAYALLPEIHSPLTVANVLDTRHGLLDLMARFGVSTETRGLAGEMSHAFQDSFVPIAEDHCGQVLYVDLRDGPQHGCVMEWDHEQGALDVVIWDNVAAMLTDIADALTLGAAARTAYATRKRLARHYAEVQCYASVTTDGELEWPDRRL
jgi:cell wall assembly regulator SMI1